MQLNMTVMEIMPSKMHASMPLATKLKLLNNIEKHEQQLFN